MEAERAQNLVTIKRTIDKSVQKPNKQITLEPTLFRRIIP